jgi:hypothetical protein
MDDKKFGCAFGIIWIICFIACVAFWSLVGWGIFEGIQYLQRH